MLKKLIIFGFIIFVVVAIRSYVVSDRTQRQRDAESQGARIPRVVLEDFVLYRYTSAVLTSRVSAKLGNVFEPNVVELYGDVEGSRNREDHVERMGAEFAKATFASESLEQLTQKPSLDKVEMSDFVRFYLRDEVLETSHAEFHQATSQVTSNTLVQIRGPGRNLSGDKGFVYDMSKDEIDLLGVVKGDFEKVKAEANP
jgi:hypothetical protein